jgi:hypothetical protein
VHALVCTGVEFLKATTMTRHRLFPATAAGAAVLACTLAAPAHAVFTMEEIQRGLSEQDALRAIKARSNVTERLKGADEGHVVLREAGGDVRGMFWVCDGKVHAASALQEGGLYAFVDRVADLSKTYGRGEVTAESRRVGAGTARTMETYWKVNGNILKLSYTPKGTERAEAMWLQVSAPSVCGKPGG